MNYRFIATDFDSLWGSSFSVPSNAYVLQFKIPKKVDAYLRSGAEAYGICITCVHPQKGSMPSFLKVFKQNVPVRDKRTSFLINSGLAAKHHAFHGVPYAWLGQMSINNTSFVGHVALQIGGNVKGVTDDLKRIKANKIIDTFSFETRRSLAAQLCLVISALEKMGIIHGDLSPGNLMIGPNDSGELICTLVDYDNFYHSSVPLLPRKIGAIPCRPLGSIGYQYINFLERLTKDTNGEDDSLYIETDRFAMAVLVCELMLWSSDVEELLCREELLLFNNIKCKYDYLPDSIVSKWPEGFNILNRTINASSIASMPSPMEWLEALGVFNENSVPILKFYQRNGNKVNPHPIQMARITKTQGDFSIINKNNWGYTYRNRILTLHIPSNGIVTRLTSNGTRSVIDKMESLQLALAPNESISADGWDISVSQ